MPVLIQSVTRALHILEILTKHPEGLSVKEIANKVGLNVSTTHHLVNTLEAENYVSWLGNSTWGLGLAIPRLYSAFLQAFQPDARLLEVLSILAKTTCETTYMTTWQNNDIVIQAILESSQALRIGGLYIGYQGFAHARAGGKALLAYLSEEQLDAYLEHHPLTPLTPYTIQDKTEFKSHLKTVAQRGYAIDQEEFAAGVCCIAAPILLADGKAIKALSVSVPTQRFIENEERLISAVTRAAQDASTILALKPIRAQAPTSETGLNTTTKSRRSARSKL